MRATTGEEMEEDIRYVESTVAYLDILGFSDAISRSATSPELVRRLYWAMRSEQERQYRQHGVAAVKESKAREIAFTAFSDSLLVSYPDATEKAIALVCGRASAAQVNLARNGLFFRGAMSTGPFLSEEGDGWRIAFGPGFITAYELEKMAVWPRLLLHPDLLSHIRDTKRFENEHRVYFVSEADSGLVYLDYLTTSAVRRVRRSLTGESEMKDPLVKLFEAHSKALREQTASFRDSAESEDARLHVLTKYRLLAAYHNRTVDAICGWSADSGRDQSRYSYGPVKLGTLSESQVKTRQRRLEQLVWASRSRRQFLRCLRGLKIDLASL